MRPAALVLGLVAALVAAKARAGAPDSYGLGSRSSAMAGAVAADASDFSANFYNPAGLAEADGIALDLGYTYNFQRLRANGQNTGVADVHGVQTGLVVPGRLGRLPFAVGLALHLPDGGLSFLDAKKQDVPRWELYGARQQLLFLAANLAIRPVRWLDLGGGIGYLSATRGSFGIRGRADVVSPFDSDLQHAVDAELTAVRYPLAGARFSWPGWGALGVAYRGQSKLDLQVAAHLQGIVDFAGVQVPLLYDLQAESINSFTPQSVTVALSFQRIEHLHVNIDLSWVNWAAYQSPVAQIAANLRVQAPPGLPLQLPSQPAPTQIVPPAFHDRIAARFGVEWRIPLGSSRRCSSRRSADASRRYDQCGAREEHATEVPLFELPVRLGYAYEPSPVPDQTGATSFIDADRHTLTLGIGAVLNHPGDVVAGALRLDLHALLSHFPERVTVKDSPASFIGDYSASGAIYGLGGTAELGF